MKCVAAVDHPCVLSNDLCYKGEPVCEACISFQTCWRLTLTLDDGTGERVMQTIEFAQDGGPLTVRFFGHEAEVLIDLVGAQAMEKGWVK